MTAILHAFSLLTPRSSVSVRGASRTLPRAEWTHEAHLAATTYLVLRRGDIDLDAELPAIIRCYNESVGGVNSETEGYHETITRTFLVGVRLFLEVADENEPLHELVNDLLLYRWAGGTGRCTSQPRASVLGRGEIESRFARPRCVA